MPPGPHDAAQVVSEIEGAGSRAKPAPCDVARPDDVSRLVAVTRERLGPIDLLAHCGAISKMVSHHELTYEQWRR